MNLKYIICPAVMCFGNLTFQHCFAVGNPNCGCVKMEPFMLLALFPLFRSYVWSTLRPIPVMRPIVVFLVFPCLVGISAVYGCCPSSPFVSFDPLHGPFHTPNTLKKSNFDAENTIKPGDTNAKRTNGSIFTLVHPNKLMFSSVFVLWEPTQPKKSPSLPCASLEPKLCNTSIRIYSPPIPQNTQQMLVCNWCGREFCVIPPQLILQTFFRVIDYAECHYTLLKINSRIIFCACNFFWCNGIVLKSAPNFTEFFEEMFVLCFLRNGDH